MNVHNVYQKRVRHRTEKWDNDNYFSVKIKNYNYVKSLEIVKNKTRYVLKLVKNSFSQVLLKIDLKVFFFNQPIKQKQE